MSLPSGVPYPPKLLGRDALGLNPCSSVDGLENVSPFEYGHFWHQFIRFLWHHIWESQLLIAATRPESLQRIQPTSFRSGAGGEGGWSWDESVLQVQLPKTTPPKFNITDMPLKNDGKGRWSFPFWDCIFLGAFAVKFLGGVAVRPKKVVDVKSGIFSRLWTLDSFRGLSSGGVLLVLGRVLYTLVKGSLHPGRWTAGTYKSPI